MPRSLLRASLASASVLSLALAAPPANAQQASQPTSPAPVANSTVLPEIMVHAPSPIDHHRHHHATASKRGSNVARTRGKPRETPAAPAVVEAAPAPLQGALPIVADQFATVTAVTNEEIRRSGAQTLGDLLNDKPGITGSSFAPGASSRPIIRGLDVNRVGIVENGIGSNGASDLGEDHFVPIDPLTTNQVEVIRGPATLRYGSNAIGGVVSAVNNRIPDALPCNPITPAQTWGYAVKAPPSGNGGYCGSFESRMGYSSIDNGREGAVLLDAATSNFAIHADGFGRKTDDYGVPNSPYRFEPGHPFNGTQANTGTRSYGGSVGGSYFFDGGFIGAAIQQNNNLYRIPGEEGEELGTRIDARQTKFTAKGEYRPDAAAIDTIRFWAGVTDYKHHEIGLADAGDPLSDGIRQTFTNKEQEGRVEVQFAPVNLRFAAMTSALGVQASHQELTAPSPDDIGSPLNGLWDPNSNTRIAGYSFNEFAFNNTTRAQIAGRIEHVNLKGSMPAFIPDVFDINTNPGDIGPSLSRNLSFTPASGSVGLIHDLPYGLVASITGQYTERAPKPAELFSRGGHDATTTFDIGNPNLKIESARSIEIGLRRATGPFRFEITGYATKFNGFIYRNLTGNKCEDGVCDADPTLELNQAVYAQRNAYFRGAEFQFQYDVMPLWAGQFGVEGQYDIVRATFDDGSNVPRIPPQRLGGGVYYRDANWLARINLLHAFAQNNVSGVETTTPGYNRLKAELSYTTKLAKNDWWGAQEMRVGIVGDNLLNEDIRNAVSYNKDQVLLPGMGVRLFANVKY
ncbi:TonB-dependent receptor protein [Afipia carboxidovorans OM5]|uniref:TonB-dependent receptor protein n=1 Tax=Afipia carboxidovorans (strain ATCC 49405 / DSM 1227 / KCTC 32145 / OM5) TaxID=504832 RepID=F8BTJ9_AFIC5|nr:TonB-dependent receptor [Afipia carboxidovorans]AEI02221.1 TonB-dependent receptor protein [Afipia carboxidovorans OM4]AEI05797.1 TonB-dependent receptor protein [Afipia carboxidovorans OM5]